MKLPVFDLSTRSSDNFPEIPLSLTIYNTNLGAKLQKPLELKPEELKQKLKIHYKKKHYLLAPTPGIRIEYPEGIFSNSFISLNERYIKIKDLKFYSSKNKSKPISVPEEFLDKDLGGTWTYYGEDDPWVEWSSNIIEIYSERFSKKPQLASGVVRVQLVNLSRKTYSAESLPEGLKVLGNSILIDHDFFPNEQYVRFFAKDKSQGYLKEAATYEFRYNQVVEGKSIETDYTAKYYYGKPTEIEYIKKTGTQEVDHAFEIELKD